MYTGSFFPLYKWRSDIVKPKVYSIIENMDLSMFEKLMTEEFLYLNNLSFLMEWLVGPLSNIKGRSKQNYLNVGSIFTKKEKN